MSEKLVHVNSYKRGDGTPVKEHYRGGGSHSFIETQPGEEIGDSQNPLGDCTTGGLGEMLGQRGGNIFDFLREILTKDPGEMVVTLDEGGTVLTGGVSKTGYPESPGGLNLPLPEILAGATEAIQIITMLGQVGAELAVHGIKIASAIKYAIENFDELGAAQFGAELTNVVGGMVQTQSVSQKAEQATLEKLSTVTDQREYKQLYDTYVQQRATNKASKAIVDRIKYANEHKNYDEVVKGLNEYSALHNNTIQSAVSAQLQAKQSPGFMNFQDHPLSQALQALGEKVNQKWVQISRTGLHKYPVVEKGLMIAGMSLEIKDAYDAFALLIASAYDFQLSDDYINQNGYLLNSVSDLSPRFQEIVSKKLRQQIGRGDAKGLILRPDSTLSQDIASSPELKEFILSNKKALLEGKVITGSTCFASNTNLALSLGNADILDTYINSNGDIVSIVFDTYDFNPDDPRWKVEWAHNVQEAKLLTNFYTINIIVIPKEEWMF